MRIFKRLTAALLTAALAVSMVVFPASAAPGSFGDVADQKTAVNADILRLMGVVSGTGDNRFNPGGTLTRAQFATMTVNFLQRETPRYATRTIFSDVRSSHWARSYVNLAASIMITDGTGENAAQIPLISGVGDGRFLPDEEITMAEAVTILLRALGYTGDKAGAVWPQGYMDLAESIGLSGGVGAGTYENITRAQAAQLFVNALKCKNAEGKVYYETLGTVNKDKTIILAVGVATDDGSSKGAIRTTSNANSEAYLPAHGDGNPTALQGRRGYLVLNEKEEIVTFVPDDSTATTVTISDAQPGYLKVGSQQYTVSGNTLVYASGSMEGKDYLSVLNGDKSVLAAGTQVTMYSEKGKIVAIYSTGGSTTPEGADAVVVLNNATAATFHQLTGGSTNFKIIKDRNPISLYQIKPYDVVTYDQVNNTLMVSDLRLTAVYTDPAPNPKTPQTLSVLGKSFDVLESAWDTIGNVKPGDSVSLLLTADGKVAGIVPASGKVRSTAIGIINGSSVSVFLPNGGTMELSGSVTGSVADGQPVIVSATKTGLSVSRLPEQHAPGAFDVSRMKLGDYTVSNSVRIYEQAGGSGVMQPVSRGDLSMSSIPADQIATYHMNTSNIVDYIVLNNVTGVAYIYGMMVGGYEETDGASERYVWNLRNGSQDVKFSPTTSYNGQSGDMIGVVLGSNREGKATIRSIVKLMELKNVKAEDFFESQGVSYVNYRGQNYRIANNVECYYNRTGNPVSKDNWLTGGDGASRFTSIKAYSDTFTIYVDDVGKEVRIIKAS